MLAEERTQLGRLLASLRKRHHKVCVECGAPFEGLKVQIYCSERCQRRAYARRRYRRHREKIMARWRAWYQRKKAQQQ
jgi:predicted nucleic acid-binding Zn ribbon protein